MVFCDTTGKECKMNNCYSCASCDIYKEKHMAKTNEIIAKCKKTEKEFRNRGLQANIWFDRVENLYKCEDQTGLWTSTDCEMWTKKSDKKSEENRPETTENIRSYNIGESDYSKHKIQPWDIWNEYKLNPFDADIVKRVLRHKKTDSRKMDYEKIIHICKERIRQIETGNDPWEE